MLASVFGGRLPPSEWYPAHEPGLAARLIDLPGGERARVIEGGDHEAPPVFLVHGWGCSAYYYRKLVPSLVEAGRRVVALDLRGHGGSDKPVERERYTGEAMADFVERAMDALDLDRPAVVAHSLGGAIMLDVAARDAGRMSSLTLLAPVGLAPVRFVGVARVATPAVAVPLVPYAAPRWSIPLVLRSVNGKLGSYTSRDVDEYWAPTQDPAFARALRALLHGYRFEPRRDDELARVVVPTLVILGGRDLLVRSRSSARRVSVLPHGVSRIIERAAHVLAEEAPEAVLAELLPHIAAHR